MATSTRTRPVRTPRKRGASQPVVIAVDFPEFTARSRGGAGSYAFMALLGVPASGSPEVLRGVTSGFSYASFEHFQRNIGLPVKDVIDLLQIPNSTLVRRKEEGRLGPLESDRLVRFGRLLGLAVELFEGDADAAREWLSEPQRALGDVTPLEMARTEVGAREVEHLIGRLEHGVFS